MKIGTLYVCTQGARMTRVGERLVIRAIDGKVLQDIPFFRLRQIVCFGSIEITSQTIFQVMRRGIDVVYLTLSGKFKCRLSNLNPKAVNTRIMQYQRSGEMHFVIAQARSIVRGKLLNYKNWLGSRHRRGVIECGREIASINDAISLTDAAQTTDELMGIEGAGTKAYFEGFRKNIKQHLGFNERNRRPPKDPVNAMLSFGYTILLHKVLAASERAGLDPFMANLHANQNNRPSLALDLMEEFRLFTVDTVVSRLVNLAQVKPGDFVYTQTEGVKMSEPTIALLVKEMQARFSSLRPYARDNNKIELQDQILRQAYHYRDVVNKESDCYQPILFSW